MADLVTKTSKQVPRLGINKTNKPVVKQLSISTKPIQNKQFSTQTQQFTLKPSQSTKTLYKQKYEQCQQRLGEENQYLRQYVIELTTKLNQDNNRLIDIHNNFPLPYNTQHYHKIIEEMKQQHERIINEHKQQIKKLTQLINIRQKCITDFKYTIDENMKDLNRLSEQNGELKQQLDRFIQSKNVSIEVEKAGGVKRRRTQSTFNGGSQWKDEGSEMSPKQIARMDILLQEFGEIKGNILRGMLDSSTAFRLVTLIQYLQQLLTKKNNQIKQLEQSKGSQSKLNQIIQKYEKSLYQNRIDAENLKYQITLLKQKKNESKQQFKMTTPFKPKHHSRKSSCGWGENTNRQHTVFQKYMDKQNNWKRQSFFSKTQCLSNRKQPLEQHMQFGNGILKDIRMNRLSGLSQRKSPRQSTAVLSVQKYNYTYNKYQLEQYLKKNIPLIAYMTLVVKITQLLDKAVKNGMCKVFTLKDITVMTCEGNCPQSMKIKCQLQIFDGVPSQQYNPPQGLTETNELTVMWSMGVIFNKILDAIQTYILQQQQLFKTIVSPQFHKIIDCLLVETPSTRMKMSQFKQMLAKLG